MGMEHEDLTSGKLPAVIKLQNRDLDAEMCSPEAQALSHVSSIAGSPSKWPPLPMATASSHTTLSRPWHWMIPDEGN